MKTEKKSLDDNQVWVLVELPPGRKAVGSKWVYKWKTGADSSVGRHKAPLVAQGYKQKYGTDYDILSCSKTTRISPSDAGAVCVAWAETTSG